jgi:hypothetical protein
LLEAPLDLFAQRPSVYPSGGLECSFQAGPKPSVELCPFRLPRSPRWPSSPRVLRSFNVQPTELHSLDRLDMPSKLYTKSACASSQTAYILVYRDLNA